MNLKAKTYLTGIGLTAFTLPFISQAQTPTSSYLWLANYEKSNALENRIAPPEGFQRTDCASGSFCQWLRNVPLKAPDSPVRYHTGKVKHHAKHFAVLDLDTGTKDLQQCADAIMRLKAEYHYSRKDYDKIHFNYTSGHKVSFDDWRQGRKPVVRGNKVSFTPSKDTVDNSYKNFRKYMTNIFMYAGSLSLSKELQPVKMPDMQVGDIFIFGGTPGHAVVVMDVAKNEAGKTMFLLAQSYMPAQDMHILQNPNNTDGSPWYSADIRGLLSTPEWHFKTSDLMRFAK